ncbi:MAG TPA: hypothetical protein VNC78_00625 [Actinomycetota bacterium]|nr:hypothetical protein [Actinomycetota bacterium]
MSRKAIALCVLVGVLVAAMGAPPASAKKKKKPKPPAACPTFTPGELGADAPTVVLTDAATEAAPVTQTVTLDMSIADLDQTGTTEPSRAYFNVQVDTALPDAGLHMHMEFPTNRDYDLWVRYPGDSSAAASSHEFNTIFLPGVGYPPGVPTNGSHGNASSATSEAIVGVKTPDCGGYTIEVENWLGEGGDLDLALYLGEATIDPLAPGAEPR